MSDLVFTSYSGWGPVEHDTSNGKGGADGGHPITLNGTTYTKGLGAHALSAVTVHIGGNCTAFTANVGLDGETNGYGSVTFTLLADGEPVATTDILHTHQAALPLRANVTRGAKLELVVGHARDGNGSDHAGWTDAKIICTD
ncbi:NPCBM/NEW2 domain-containing protein [Streptomyces thinghirensis]|uniref:Glycosyl hydrolase family 98 putative carbohydrate-binding module domain-containing protein n=1 Tax=Streptomyces thinghirensis TaxID=551547 RepID=A0ABP9T4I8_9ACTN